MPDIEIGAVDGGSAQLRGYLAEPLGHGPWPGVVAIHELLGLNDTVRRQADRLAGAGYLTLAPDLFSDGGALRCIVGTFRAMAAGRGKPISDIAAAQEYLRADPNCSGKVGVIGFCMGGGFALIMADKGFDAAATNYGPLPRDPKNALRGACPMVASYGGKDVTLRGAARKLEATLDALGVDNDVKEYPSAGHSFLNDDYFGPPLLHPSSASGASARSRSPPRTRGGASKTSSPCTWRRISTNGSDHQR